jgi:hypothetical protein
MTVANATHDLRVLEVITIASNPSYHELHLPEGEALDPIMIN